LVSVADRGEDQFSIQALSRGLRLLALFSVDHPEWTLSQLVKTTGLHKATAYRVVRTMESEGFLVFDAEGGTYHLGPSVLPLSYLAQTQSELDRIAKPFMEKLAGETSETANLAVEFEGTFVVTATVLTSNVFKPTLPLGRVLTDLSNTHGKVFVAYKPEVERAKILARPQPQLTPNSITDPSELAAELARVLEEGVAYDLEENGVGACSVGAPVFGRNGTVIAVLSVVAPRERFGPEEKARAAEAVKRVSAEFSAYLGLTPDT
jgi:DNA-binding IclR family transcriptional regulator